MWEVGCTHETFQHMSNLGCLKGVINEVMEFFGQRVQTCQDESPWPSMLGAGHYTFYCP